MSRREYYREWRKRNLEKNRKYQKEYRKKYPERIKEYQKRWLEKVKGDFEFIKKRREYNRKYSREHRSGFLKLRFEILKRDNFVCQYCGRNAPKVELQVDHIIPKGKEGKNTKENLITACAECNLGKGDVLLKQEKTTMDTRSNDLAELRKDYQTASPRDKRKIEAAGLKISNETRAVKSMRESLLREHRAGRTENIKDIHDIVQKDRKYRSEP